MQELGLVEAWTSWLAGNNVSHDLLWGVPIFWWGRYGQIVAILSSASLIADIIGAERIRVVGDTLHERASLGHIGVAIRNTFSWYTAMMVFLFSATGSQREQEALARSNEYSADNMNFFLSIVIGIASGVIYFLTPDTFGLTNIFERIGVAIVIFLLVGGVGLITVIPLISLVLILVLNLLLAIVNIILIQPFAWALSQPHLDSLIKLTSLVLLIAGFHFNLLAS